MTDTMTRDTETRETVARLRYVRISPSKVRQVLELIRGHDIEDARDALRRCERSVAREIGKLLDSAVANAEHNDHVPEDELFVARAFADEGPILKRWRPRARGRGVRIHKRTSHVTIALTRFGDEELDRRREREAVSPRRRPVRRRPAAEPHDQHDHDEDHDHDHEGLDHDHEGLEAAATEAKRAPAKKAPAKRGAEAKRRRPMEPAKKATTKKATKKTTKKKAASRKRTPKKDS
jgi:large subunit ribosomal protein L22